MANKNLPERDAEQVFGEIFMEAQATAISDRIMEVINKEFPDKGDEVIFSAIENVLCNLLSEIPDNEHFAMMGSFVHSVALKLFNGGE